MLQKKIENGNIYAWDNFEDAILKLENSRNMLEIVFLCSLNMLNSTRLALITTEM